MRTEYGVLHFTNQNGNMLNVSGFEEKPEIPYVVSMGVYVLEPAALDYIEQGTYLDLPDLVLRLLAEGRQVGSYLYDGYWLDIGRHEDYEKALIEFEQLRPMFLPEREPQTGTRPVKVLVTGGPATSARELVDELLAAGHEVRVLDVLLHGQEDVAAAARLARRGPPARRRPRRRGAQARARGRRRRGAPGRDRRRSRLRRAIPSCPTRSTWRARAALVADARAAGVERFLFASTCSNYGRMADPTVPIDETGELAPVSLYAEQKVAMEKSLLEGEQNGLSRHLPALRDRLRRRAPHALRPDRQRVHARPLGRAQARRLRRDLLAPVRTRARRRPRGGAGAGVARSRRSPARVFNAGHSDENYRKLDLVEIITERLGRGDVEYVTRTEDPRDYKVSFERIKDELGFEPVQRVPDRHRRARRRARGGALRRPVLAPLLEHRLMSDAPADPAVRRQARAGTTSTPSPDTLRSGWLTMGPRTQEFEQVFAEHLGVRATRSRWRTAPRRCTSPTWRPAWAPATR